MKNTNRVGVTLRFSKQELFVIGSIIQRVAGHRDIKKGMKDIIKNVTNHALEQLKAEELAKRERTTGGDTSPPPDSENNNSIISEADKDIVADPGASEGEAGLQGV